MWRNPKVPISIANGGTRKCLISFSFFFSSFFTFLYSTSSPIFSFIRWERTTLNHFFFLLDIKNGNSAHNGREKKSFKIARKLLVLNNFSMFQVFNARPTIVENNILIDKIWMKQWNEDGRKSDSKKRECNVNAEKFCVVLKKRNKEMNKMTWKSHSRNMREIISLLFFHVLCTMSSTHLLRSLDDSHFEVNTFFVSKIILLSVNLWRRFTLFNLLIHEIDINA